VKVVHLDAVSAHQRSRQRIGEEFADREFRTTRAPEIDISVRD
jgi:hypothetical protein